MKIRNKKTGEIYDPVSGKTDKEEKVSKENKLAKFEKRYSESEERIESRTNIAESIKKSAQSFKDGGTLGKILSGGKIGLEMVSAPFRSIESSIANPALQMQAGNFNPQDIARSIMQGATLQKEGQLGDVYKNVGVNPFVADTLGVAGMLSPAVALRGAMKSFGAISKMSDKGLNEAGRSIIAAVNEAKSNVGKKVGEEFQKHANHIPVDNMKFLDNVSKLPKVVQRKLKDYFGDLEDYASDLNVGKLREFKTYLGKLRPNDFGKEAKGIKETIDVMDLNKGYGAIKGMMWDAINSSSVPKKISDNLRYLDDSYSTVIKAGRYIKKKVIDSTIDKPTKAGSFSEEVLRSPDTTSREALNAIKLSGKKAMNLINRGMDKIESFQKWQSAKNLASRVSSAVVFGGVAGGIGGKILQKTQGNN